MKRLNDDETVLLISFVQSRECLWNENSTDFKRISITRKLWNEIGEQLNISGDEARSKWKNLKDKFKRQQRQIPEENPDSVPSCSSAAPQWKFYNAMLFLRDSTPHPDHQQAITSNHIPMAAGGSGDQEIADEKYFQEYDFDFLVRETPDRESSGARGGKNRGHWTLGCGTKRKNTDDCHVDEENGIRLSEGVQIQAAAGSAVAKGEQKSEDDYYFLMSLLPYIRALSPIEKLELRSRMQNLVTDSYKKHDLNKRSKVNH